MRTLLLISVTVFSLCAQQPPAPSRDSGPPANRAGSRATGLGNDEVLKRVDDLMWHVMLDDIAHVDKVEYTSLPPARPGNARAPGATNPLIIRAYTFIPKNLDRSRKQPLLVFCHQGIHANEDTRDAHVFRELLEQGYSIVVGGLSRQFGLWAGILRTDRLRRARSGGRLPERAVDAGELSVPGREARRA